MDLSSKQKTKTRQTKPRQTKPRPKLPVKVQKIVPERGAAKKDKTLYVGNLRYDKTEDGMRNLLGRYGEVKWVKLIIDPKTKKKKGIAFAEMSTPQGAKEAIKGLDGKIVEGRMLKVSIAEERNPPRLLDTPSKEKLKSSTTLVKKEKKLSVQKGKAKKVGNPFKQRSSRPS